MAGARAAGAPPASRLRCAHARSTLPGTRPSARVSSPRQATRFEEALELYREPADERGQAACLAQLGWLASARGEVDAASASSTRSLAIAEEIGAWDVASVARSTLADLAAQRGAFPQAAELLEQSLALRRRLGDRRNDRQRSARPRPGRAPARRPRRARQLADEGLELAREVSDTWSISVGTATLGLLALDAGDHGQARSHLGIALELAWRRGDDRTVAEVLVGLAAVAAPADPHVAARIWGAADALRDVIGASPSPTERALEERYLDALRPALGERVLDSEREQARRCRSSRRSTRRSAASRARSQPSARSRWKAALISARWVNACGKLPSASPVLPICSAYRPRWFA